MKAETGVFKVTDNSMGVSVESNYLFNSTRKRVSEILKKDGLEQNDIIDVFVGLHIVLELGINSLFRKIITPTLKKGVDIHEMIENLDNVSFRDKVVVFVYYSKFNFDDIKKATEYHKLINKIKSFSELRNKLLHGHSIMEFSGTNGISRSGLKKKLNAKKLKEQLDNFKFITEGLGYYLDCLDTDWTPQGKDELKKMYLNGDFIPEAVKVNE